mgnify:CR=1 FL=1
MGFDSLWLSEVLTGQVFDPVVGLSWAAASNPRLKVGTTMLLPGRNVLRLAKQLASLDVLSNGRLLVTLVPGLTYPPEREAIGLEPKRRGAFIDEALPLLRRLWAGETVSYEGIAGSFRDVKLWPLPVQQPLEVWLGGTIPAALERCGRLSDGWLPSQCTPEEAAEGRKVIEDVAAKAGRSISSEHFGMSLGYARDPIDPQMARVMTARRPRSVELTPVGFPALRAVIERFLAVGFSKFVVRPVVAPKSWRAELRGPLRGGGRSADLTRSIGRADLRTPARLRPAGRSAPAALDRERRGVHADARGPAVSRQRRDQGAEHGAARGAGVPSPPPDRPHIAGRFDPRGGADASCAGDVFLASELSTPLRSRAGGFPPRARHVRRALRSKPAATSGPRPAS